METATYVPPRPSRMGGFTLDPGTPDPAKPRWCCNGTGTQPCEDTCAMQLTETWDY